MKTFANITKEDLAQKPLNSREILYLIDYIANKWGKHDSKRCKSSKNDNCMVDEEVDIL